MTDMRVKVCGITNLQDAQVALEAGADYLGFILYPKSPRYIAPEDLRKLRIAIGDWLLQFAIRNSQFAPCFIGVFVNETVEHITETLAFTGLDYAQLHGDEPPEFLPLLGGKAFKALGPADAESALQSSARFAPLGVDNGPQLLIDAYAPTVYGGTGKRADWGVAADLARRYPRLLLAGGLTPDNVAQAIAAVRPWAVDVSSGVEAAPGRKDHDAVRAFIRAARVGAVSNRTIDEHP